MVSRCAIQMSGVRRFLSRAGIVLVFAIAVPSCDRQADLPPQSDPEKPRENAPPADPSKTLQIKLDSNLLIPNMAFQIEKDAADPAWMTVMLASSEPSPSGARVFFESTERHRTWDQLKETRIDYGGSPVLDKRGNGIFTATVIYHPKLVSIRVTSVSEKFVSGEISGEFYKFRVGVPTVNPEVVEGSGTFDAVRVDR